MNTEIWRTKRVLVPTAVAAALVVGGGAAYASTGGSSPDKVTGSQHDKVAAAAVQAAGGGKAIEVERSDDAGEAFEAEVVKPDGSRVEVTLDKNLAVVKQEADDGDHEGQDSERPLTPEEQKKAGAAAVAAVGGGTVTDAEAEDTTGTGADKTVAYEVEVKQGATKWEVDLAKDFSVIHKAKDD